MTTRVANSKPAAKRGHEQAHEAAKPVAKKAASRP